MWLAAAAFAVRGEDFAAACASEAPRPDAARAVQLSGIAWAGGDAYYAVDDKDGGLYALRLEIDSETGRLAEDGIHVGESVRVAGAVDMEGCAFDAASGAVWIADEADSTIREVSTATGETLRSAIVPAIYGKIRRNFGLESLTLSPDGLTMWTANEEALECDGDKSSEKHGSTVRLTRFTRRSPQDDWRADVQWAYRTESVGCPPWAHGGDVKTRSGVVALAALRDGRLLVLERNFRAKGIFVTRIFLVDGLAADGSPATDVSGIDSLDGASFSRVAKTRIFRGTFFMTNYEGMCVGPALADGSVALVLVADGGNAFAKIMTLRLRVTGRNL